MAAVSTFSAATTRSPEKDLEGEKARLARMLIDSLSADIRAALIQELSASIDAPATGATPTGIIATVLKFRRGETVTAAELRQEVADRGVEVAPKEVYNAIGYLARMGRLTRIGYGRYLVDGMAISTSDELGGQRAKDEDLSDDDKN